ncbi:SecDF P1 head subdomain-containing protein [Hyunsoonleella sp. 2307UL5-6]|uniref:SecDF P1 head subdomain-containing protein n=1 Tax=Hyunsoonleella sp. 2307UL5-6 TaxID=3384768 RepID=UPI0039BC2385
MRKLCVVLLLVCECSCQFLEPKQEFRFVYGFENELNVSKMELSKTVEVIKKRLTYFGVEHTVNCFTKNEIEVNIRANDLNTKRIDQLISNKGKLEFWELYNRDSILPYFLGMDVKQEHGNTLGKIKSLVVSIDRLGRPTISRFYKKDTSYVNYVLAKETSRHNLPIVYNKVKFLWGLRDKENTVPLYAIKTKNLLKPPLNGRVINKVTYTKDSLGKPTIVLEMDKQGTLIWERMTTKAYQNKTSIAITLNGVVYSTPQVTKGPVRKGKFSISGGLNLDEAQNLAAILSSRTPIPQLKLLEQSIIKN